MDIQITLSFSLIACGECGVRFYIPNNLYEQRLEDKNTFYCPNGHPRIFSESTGEKFKKLYLAEVESRKLLQRDNADFVIERNDFIEKIARLESRLKKRKKAKGAK